MRKLMFCMAVSMVTSACTPSHKDVAVEENTDSDKVLFEEGNIPAVGVDVTGYSNGIQHIGLPTTQVQKTIDFYRGLGFSLATRHDIGGRDFAFMQLGNLLLEIIPTDDPAMVRGAVDHFCLDAKDIDSLFVALKDAGYTMLDDSINDIAFWDKGARYFFIQGPNNERIEFCEILK